jgi:ribosomal protein L11 methyltransferase
VSLHSEAEIRLSSGVGWGDGSHPTTKMCLQAIRHFHPKSEFHALDFGSGSGILSIAIAQRGGIVDAVEIEDAAIETSKVNARLNGVEDKIRVSRELPANAPPRYDWVIANILQPVLLHYSEELVRLLKPKGKLVLSGLVATDVPILMVRYSELLGGRTAEIYHQGEWRCLVWQ